MAVRSKERQAWYGMKQRCLNPQATNYQHYGGRGISLCDRWLHSFEAFLADMGPKPSPQHSLDRIDNDGDYEPGNCRWATQAEQLMNRRQWDPRPTVPPELVARIVARRLDGATGATIARELTSEGVPTAYGGRAWSTATVLHVARCNGAPSTSRGPMPREVPDGLLSVDQAAAILGRSHTWVLMRCTTVEQRTVGLLKAIRMGQRWMIDPKDVESFAETMRRIASRKGRPRPRQVAKRVAPKPRPRQWRGPRGVQRSR